MAVVRQLEERDIPDVARLFGRVHGGACAHAERAAYFRDIFFGNPWVDPALPSWVACEGRRIVGFIGVVPRQMRYKARIVRVAVLSQLMVEREKIYALAAVQLLRRALAGPQDLTLSDGANEPARSMWEACGGSTSTLYGLQWRRLLRPTQCLLDAVPGGGGRAAALLVGPLAAAADAYAARRMKLVGERELTEEPLDATTLVAALENLPMGVALQPHYEAQSLKWLLAQAYGKRRYGTLQARLLRLPGGKIAGWFLYFLNSGMSRVLQLAARPGSEGLVLEHLFQHAWQRGAAALEGRMEPRLSRILGERHCFFLAAGVHTLLHAREPELVATLERGDAYFSRLDGEWWMRFFGEPQPAAAAARPVSPLRLLWTRARYGI